MLCLPCWKPLRAALAEERKALVRARFELEVANRKLTDKNDRLAAKISDLRSRVRAGERAYDELQVLSWLVLIVLVDPDLVSVLLSLLSLLLLVD